MTQIHIDAINKSLIDGTQYILSDASKKICISDKKELLSYLKSNWDILGVYKNGTKEENYKINEQSQIEKVKNYIETENKCYIQKNPIFAVSVSFQEFFDYISFETEELRGFVTFFYFDENNIFRNESINLEDSKAKEFKDLVFTLGVKQNKEFLMNILEKNY